MMAAICTEIGGEERPVCSLGEELGDERNGEWREAGEESQPGWSGQATSGDDESEMAQSKETTEGPLHSVQNDFTEQQQILMGSGGESAGPHLFGDER